MRFYDVPVNRSVPTEAWLLTAICRYKVNSVIHIIQTASLRGHEGVVKLLLDKSANINAQGRLISMLKL
jgi:hypothetical protein